MLGDIDTKIKSWIMRPEVMKVLHLKDGAQWLDSDEKGPVAENLKADFVASVVDKIEYLLNAKMPILM